MISISTMKNFFSKTRHSTFFRANEFRANDPHSLKTPLLNFVVFRKQLNFLFLFLQK